MGVLDGVKVVELAEHGFVPSCGAILADWGADVVKIERPTGDPLRAVMGAGLVADTGDFNFLFELYNRNKRGITLDLRIPDGTRRVRPTDRARRRAHHELPAVRARRSCASRPRTCGRSTRGSCTRRATGRASAGPTPTRAASTPSATGRVAVSVTSSLRPARRSSCPEARSATRRVARCSPAASPPRCTGGSRRARASSSTSRSSRRRSGSSAPTSPRRRSCARSPPSCKPAKALANPLVGPYRTIDDRWMMFSMLDDERHWAPTCRALGIDELIDDPRFVDTEARDRARRRAARDGRRARSGRSRSPTLAGRLAAEDTIFSTLASPLEVIDDPQVVENGVPRAAPRRTRRARLATAPMQFDDEMVEVRRGRARPRASTPTRSSASSGTTTTEIDAAPRGPR